MASVISVVNLFLFLLFKVCRVIADTASVDYDTYNGMDTTDYILQKLE